MEEVEEDQVTSERRCVACGDGVIRKSLSSVPTCDKCGEEWIDSETAKLLDTREAGVLKCEGDAHSNPYIDNCGLCAPHWYNIPVCPDCGERLVQFLMLLVCPTHGEFLDPL